LAELVCGTDYPGSNDTLRVYVRILRIKLESLSNSTVSINSKPGIGFVLEVK
jgi:DNA-binding response OmpR family regulator